MATYELIAKNVLGSNTASVTFSSIPGTYDDLLLVSSVRTDYSGNSQDGISVSFNGSTSGFTRIRLTGSGSSVASNTNNSNDIGTVCGPLSTASTFGSIETYIPNYVGPTTKSFSSSSAQETNGATARIDVIAGLWSNTSVITSIALSPRGGTTLVTGSSFYLYGITKA